MIPGHMCKCDQISLGLLCWVVINDFLDLKRLPICACFFYFVVCWTKPKWESRQASNMGNPPRRHFFSKLWLSFSVVLAPSLWVIHWIISGFKASWQTVMLWQTWQVSNCPMIRFISCLAPCITDGWTVLTFAYQAIALVFDKNLTLCGLHEATNVNKCRFNVKGTNIRTNIDAAVCVSK